MMQCTVAATGIAMSEAGYERLFGGVLSDFRSSPISQPVSPPGARALAVPQIPRLEVRLEDLGAEGFAGRLSRFETPPLQRPGCLLCSKLRTQRAPVVYGNF